MASGRLIDYLGSGPIASRPSSPDLHTGTVGLWFATDTDVLSAWDGSTWEDVTGGGGASTFLALTDTPASYTGQRYKPLVVNTAEDGVEFADLVAGLSIYVNAATGDDTNDGLTVGTPVETIDRALEIAQQHTPNPMFSILNINLAAGSYGGVVVSELRWRSVTFKGAGVASTSVLYVVASGSGLLVTLDGLTVASDGTQFAPVTALLDATVLCNGGVEIAAHADDGTYVLLGGGTFASTGSLTLSGSPLYTGVMDILGLSQISLGDEITIADTPDFPMGFIQLTGLSRANIGATFSGAATGLRFSADGGAVINASVGDLDYLPGDAPGTVMTGARYIYDTGELPPAGGGSDRSGVSALATSGSVAIDYALGDYFTLALAGNVSTFTFSNLPGSGKGATLMIRITQDSTPRTVGWPASFKWAGGTPGAVSTGSGDVDVLAITTFDNGTTWQATLGKEFS